MEEHKNIIPEDYAVKCHAIIHTATVAAGAAGAIPIPISDALPIGAIQIGMIISLGKVFDLTIGRATAEAIAGVTFATNAGRFVYSNLLKLIPGIGSIVGSVTAAAITELLGWTIADDFYRIKIGERPEKIVRAFGDIVNHFGKIKRKKK